MDPKCPYSSKREAIRSKEEEGEGSRERFEDDKLLALKIEKGAMSQEMHGIHFIWDAIYHGLRYEMV